ncbi:MAG: YibE/F family protein [Chloroflexi bacterium]|nr:YibE/F family protein [Chloroflexota bacterium]
MRILLALVALLLISCADPGVGRAGTVFDAHVTKVISTSTTGPSGGPVQQLEIELDGSLYRGDRVQTGWGGRSPINANGLLREGDRVLVTQRRGDKDERIYTIEEVVRLPSLLPFVAMLVVALLLVARLKGLSSLGGLAASVGVFLLAIVPALQRGDDPLVATLVGTAIILVITVYLVHGFNRKSTAALAGTLIALAVVALLAAISLGAGHITGLGSEEAVFLAVGTDYKVDLSRLVLAGVIVGSLGALVDMAVGQASTTFELAAVDGNLRGRALYGSALNVGRDHIGSLVNTLALAYFGGALPLIVLLSLGNSPLLVTINSETIVVSILSVVIASIGLVCCVPVTTAIAVRLVRE